MKSYYIKKLLGAAILLIAAAVLAMIVALFWLVIANGPFQKEMTYPTC